jgi:hypothetical protein
MVDSTVREKNGNEGGRGEIFSSRGFFQKNLNERLQTSLNPSRIPTNVNELVRVRVRNGVRVRVRDQVRRT